MARKRPRKPARRFRGIEAWWDKGRWKWRWRAFLHVGPKKRTGPVRDRQEDALADREDLKATHGAFRRSAGISLEEALDQVIAAARRRGVAERTLQRDYGSRQRKLQEFLGPATALAELADVDVVLDRFVAPARARERAASTIKRDLWILGLAFVSQELPNAAAEARARMRNTLKAAPGRTEYIPAAELRGILAQIRAQSEEDADLLEVLAVTGMRAGESGRVLLEDVQLEPPRIHVRKPKDRGNPRICEIPWQTVPALRRMVDRARARAGSSKADRAELIEDSEQTIGTVCQRWRKSLALGRRFNGRVLRHSFNMAAIEVGGRLTEVMGLAGHKRATTTERYLHEQGERRQEIVGRIGSALVGSETEQVEATA